jgi:hypothetical protein
MYYAYLDRTPTQDPCLNQLLDRLRAVTIALQLSYVCVTIYQKVDEIDYIVGYLNRVGTFDHSLIRVLA